MCAEARWCAHVCACVGRSELWCVPKQAWVCAQRMKELVAEEEAARKAEERHRLKDLCVHARSALPITAHKHSF